MTPAPEQTEMARQVVADWFIQLWATKPDWLVKIPDKESTKGLIDRIANLIATIQAKS